jgi:hypothetical protein
MMFVVEAFEGPQFAAEVDQRTKVLSAKEAFVVGIVESFDNAVTPRFPFRDKDDFDAQVEAQPDHEPKASGIAIRSSERELVVDLEVSGKAQTVPLSQEGLAKGHVVLGDDCFQGNSITADIDDVEAVETNSAGEMARPDKVHLVCHTGFPCLDLRIAWSREFR